MELSSAINLSNLPMASIAFMMNSKPFLSFSLSTLDPSKVFIISTCMLVRLLSASSPNVGTQRPRNVLLGTRKEGHFLCFTRSSIDLFSNSPPARFLQYPLIRSILP